MSINILLGCFAGELYFGKIYRQEGVRGRFATCLDRDGGMVGFALGFEWVAA